MQGNGIKIKQQLVVWLYGKPVEKGHANKESKSDNYQNHP
jgi:hypothetical protein